MIGARHVWFGLLVGAGGVALLLALGIWQATKYLAASERIPELEARMAAEPLRLGVDAVPEDAEYRRAEAYGRFVDAPSLRMGVAHERRGGNVLISAFELETGGRVLVQRGFVPEGWTRDVAPPEGPARVVGVLVDPQEVGAFTPDPDFDAGIVFARDVPAMAAHFGADPIFLVEDATQLGAARYPEPIPVEVDRPTNHFGYAVTWLALAAIWAAMTALLLFRRREAAE